MSNNLEPHIKKDVMLALYTNFKVGGPADFFVEVKNVEEIKEALWFAKEKNIPMIILGGGTNILVSDKGFRGLVIQINDLGLTIKDNCIEADAGCTMGQVVVAAQKAGLTGLEWAVGLPGTVGGAVYGNAGCFGGETADVVTEATVVAISNFQFPISKQDLSDIFKIKTVDKTYFEFGYRHSKLKETGEIILSATFRLKKGSPEEIATGMDRIRQKSIERVKEQPLGAWTAGSTFNGVKVEGEVLKRLEASDALWQNGVNRAGFLSAGWLLEQVGLKGFRVGNASFSSHHANFILNHGRATAADIMQLIHLAKERVRKKFGIALEEEIRYIGL